MEELNLDPQLMKEVQKLVKARLTVLPDDVCLSVGSDGKAYSKDELIMHVEQADEVGKKIMEIDLKFLQALKNGELYNNQIVFNN